MKQPEVGKAPTTLRETFDRFRFYRRELRASGLFIDVDFSGCTARQVFQACHGRAPGTIHEAMAHYRFTPRELFVAAVSSGEFQNKLVARFLSAHPEKQRLVFVHIPKCAGSDMSTHLIGRFASLNTKIVDQTITDISQLHDAIKDISLEILASDRIYLHGHTHLQTYVDWGALRFCDEVFTTIRRPSDLIVSQVNYVLTRIFSDEDPIQNDTRGWREEFKISNLEIYAEHAAKKRLASLILRNRGVVPENFICRYLGDGTYNNALERVVIHNVEVTTLENYHSWLKSRWGINKFTKMNESIKFISQADFNEDDQNYLASITNEDQKFFDHVQRRIKELGTHSLKGDEILDAHIPSLSANIKLAG